LLEFAANLRSAEQFSVTAYRLKGSEFALLFPGFNQNEILRLIKQLKNDIAILGKPFQQEDLIHIGVIHYERSSDFDKLYPGMVEAYEHAKNIGNNAYFIKDALASPMSDMEWKILISSAIDNNLPTPEITFTAEAHDYKHPLKKSWKNSLPLLAIMMATCCRSGPFFRWHKSFSSLKL
jgi:hypothetical protein